MSDLCLYKFEDIVWDDFCWTDDHIVPNPVFERADDYSLRGDSHKKLCLEVTSISYSTKERSSAGYVGQQRKEGGVSSLSRAKNTMLEKDRWSYALTDVFPSSSDGNSVKEASNLASGKASLSSHALKNNKADSTGDEVCANDAIPGNKNTDVDYNTSSDPLGDISHTGNNLNFENAEEIDSSDFLCYGSWPEIENFEDVDRMFRSCDSTFGLGASEQDDSDWFSSADKIGASGDVVTSNFNFSCLESSPLENVSANQDSSSKRHSFNDSAMMSVGGSPRVSEKPDSYISLENGPSTANDKEGFIPKAQINEHQKQVKLENHSEGERKEHTFGNGNVSYMSKLSNEVLQLPSKAISHQAFPTGRMQQHALGSDTCNYLQNQFSYVNSDSSPLSDLTSVNPKSFAVKSEKTDLASLSPRNSSHSSNQLQSMNGPHDPPLPLTAPTGSGKRETLHENQGSHSSVGRSLKHGNALVHASLDDPDSVLKKVQYPRAKSEKHSDIEGGNLFAPAEIGSSNTQEGSPMYSVMDDISLEAASFCQLQLVMEQLDLRTKICIRDSLYRLARSAEQRHNHANLNGSCGDGRNSSGTFMTEGENNSTDIETDTNPIDRSVAHLLFYRPSESSPVPPHDSLPFKSPSTWIRGSVTSPSVMVENLNNVQETASKIKISDR